MKEYLVHKEQYQEFTVEIYQDVDGLNNPRDWDNLGFMACYHNRYKLGDSPNNLSAEELKSFISRDDVVSLPLYLYDHSGITMSTRPFSCPWDSGQVGYIFATYEKIRQNYNRKHITSKLIYKVNMQLQAEVEVYNYYLMGGVYGFTVKDDQGNHIDSCRGYIGDWNRDGGALWEAKFFIDGMLISKSFVGGEI